MTLEKQVSQPNFFKMVFAALGFITALGLLAGLNGCTSTSLDGTEKHRVERYSLIRSAAYTQHQLLAIELEESQVINQPRRELLVNSYCDLVTRKAIFTSHQPSICAESNRIDKNPVTSRCVANFHRCIKTCDLRSNDCRVCEAVATECSAPSHTDSSPHEQGGG